MDARCHTLKIDTRYLKCKKFDAKEEKEEKAKEEVSEAICVENDAKVDARCHTLKIDISYLKCTKFDAEEEEKEKVEEKEKEKKEKEQEKKDKKGKIRIFSPKFPFRANQKKPFTQQEIKILSYNIRIV